MCPDSLVEVHKYRSSLSSRLLLPSLLIAIIASVIHFQELNLAGSTDHRQQHQPLSTSPRLRCAAFSLSHPPSKPDVGRPHSSSMQVNDILSPAPRYFELGDAPPVYAYKDSAAFRSPTRRAPASRPHSSRRPRSDGAVADAALRRPNYTEIVTPTTEAKPRRRLTLSPPIKFGFRKKEPPSPPALSCDYYEGMLTAPSPKSPTAFAVEKLARLVDKLMRRAVHTVENLSAKNYTQDVAMPVHFETAFELEPHESVCLVRILVMPRLTSRTNPDSVLSWRITTQPVGGRLSRRVNLCRRARSLSRRSRFTHPIHSALHLSVRSCPSRHGRRPAKSPLPAPKLPMEASTFRKTKSRARNRTDHRSA